MLPLHNYKILGFLKYLYVILIKDLTLQEQKTPQKNIQKLLSNSSKKILTMTKKTENNNHDNKHRTLVVGYGKNYCLKNVNSQMNDLAKHIA